MWSYCTQHWHHCPFLQRKKNRQWYFEKDVHWGVFVLTPLQLSPLFITQSWPVQSRNFSELSTIACFHEGNWGLSVKNSIKQNSSTELKMTHTRLTLGLSSYFGSDGKGEKKTPKAMMTSQCKESDTTERLTLTLWSPRAVSRFLGSQWGRLRQPPHFTKRAPPLPFIRFPCRNFYFLKKVRGFNILKNDIRTFLVVQWLRIHLPRQGTQLRFLVGELKSHTRWGN